jgi:hypothetical protein
VVIEHSKAGDGDREDLGELFEAIFDPLFAVLAAFPAEAGSPHASGNAVVIRGYIQIDELRTRDCHG